MPTARDKFLELRKSGVDAQTARKQAYGDIIPPVGTTSTKPTTPPVQNPPTVPPQQTTPPQTVTGVNGEQFQVAPVNPDTGLSQPAQTPTPPQTVPPVQPTTPEPVKTETTPQQTTKTEAPIDYTQAKGREQDIIKNLDTFKAQGMTPEQIIKASDYANATPEKKALIEPYLKQSPVTASSLYNLIASKQEVPLEQKSSGAYRVANNRYQRVNQYVNMTPSEVNKAFTSGKLVEGSQTFEDLKAMNPKLVQDAVNLRKVNGNKTFLYINNPDGTKTNVLEKNFADEYEEDYPDIVELIKSTFNTPSYEEMMSKINTPEVKAAQNKASAIETEMNDIQTAMEAVDKDVDKEMAGSGATGSRIALEKSARKEALQKQYDSKLRDYTTQYNKATNLINTNTEMFKYTQEQNKAMQTALQSVYMTQYQNQLQRENTLQSQAFQQMQTLQNQAFQREQTATQNQNQIAMQKLQNDLQQGNAQFQTIGNKVYKIQNGQMTETGITVPKDNQFGVIGYDANKNPQYGFINTQTNQVTPLSTGAIGLTTGLTTLNGATDLTSLASKYPNVAAFKNNNPSGITWEATSQGLKDAWTQAGIQFEQGTARPANEGGSYVKFASAEDGIKAKMVAITRGYGNATVNQYLDKWGTGSGNIKVGFDKNKTINELSEQEFNELVTKQIAWESPQFLKEYEKAKGTQSTGYTATEEAWANNIMNGKAKLSDITNKDNVNKGNILQIMNQKSGGTTGSTQQNLQAGLDIVKSLIDHPGFTDAVGLPSVFTNPFGYSLPATSARDFKAELKRFEAIGFLNMIPQMQGMGALSNAEGARLAAAYSKLSDTGIGESEYKAELERLKTGMETALARMGVNTQELPKPTGQQNTNTGAGLPLESATNDAINFLNKPR